jgi:hypothetical protein
VRYIPVHRVFPYPSALTGLLFFHSNPLLYTLGCAEPQTNVLALHSYDFPSSLRIMKDKDYWLRISPTSTGEGGMLLAVLAFPFRDDF